MKKKIINILTGRAIDLFFVVLHTETIGLTKVNADIRSVICNKNALFKHNRTSIPLFMDNCTNSGQNEANKGFNVR
ncbi:hypothetical protein [Gracilibacillus lacisalsi]|uniref:hypothetical protein n=1 Tax=Gracilibacillus lacisalsi TaxID=393087 RepID=UPI00146154A7|nr:hypothetical protein [Gracilibacillus lacisalsi]